MVTAILPISGLELFGIRWQARMPDLAPPIRERRSCPQLGGKGGSSSRRRILAYASGSLTGSQGHLGGCFASYRKAPNRSGVSTGDEGANTRKRYGDSFSEWVTLARCGIG